MRFGKKSAAVKCLAATSAALAALSVVSSTASAADGFWSGTSPATSNFTDPFNWAGFFQPGSGDRAVFSAPTSPTTPRFGSGTITNSQALVSGGYLFGAWNFNGVSGGENWRITNDLTLINTVGNANITFNGVDVNAGTTNIGTGCSIVVLGSTTFTTGVMLTQGTGTFGVASGNTIRGAISSQGTGVNVVEGLLDTEILEILGGGVVNIRSTGNLILNQNSNIASGTLNFESGGTMSFNFGSTLQVALNGKLNFESNHAFGNNAKIKVVSGGDVIGASYLDLGNGNTGSLSVDGAGSTISALGSTDWGNGAAGLATVTFSNSGAGNYASLDIARTGGGRADVSLLSSGQLTTSSSLTVGPSTGTTSLGRITVAGGTLNNNGTSIFRNGGQLILTSGGVNFNDGTFAAGSTLNWSGGVVNIASGKTLNVAGGTISNTAGGQALGNGATIRVTAGGKFDNNSYFDIANGNSTGTLIVDGVGSRFTSNSSFSDWGKNTGNAATITLQNSGAGTFNGIQMSSAGGSSTLTIASSAVVTTVGSFSAGGTGSNARVFVSGGTLNTLSTTNLSNGATISLSSGGWNLSGDGTLATGSTLNWSGGTLNIASGKTLTVAGGQVQATTFGGLTNNATLRINANGFFGTSKYFDIANSNTSGGIGTLIVDGANANIVSTASTGNYSDWARLSGNAGTFTFANGGAGTYYAGLQIAGAGGNARVSIASGASLNVTSITTGSTGGVASISISGGSLNVVGTAQFLNGTAINATGTGLLRLSGSSTFSTGATFNGTSSATNSGLNWVDGQTLTFDGGAGTIAAVGSSIPNNGSLRITNGGSFTAQENFNINGSSGTLLVSGANSRLIINNTTSISNFWDGPATIAEFANGGAGTITGQVLLGNFGGSGTLNILSGGSMQAGELRAGSGGGTATINVNGGTLRTTGLTRLNGGATLNYTAGTINLVGTLVISDLTPGGRVLLTPGGNKVLRVGGLDIPSANNGKIDLSNNAMIVDYTTTSPLSTVRGYITTGRNNGDWLGNGVTSSSAASNAKTGLGIIEASDIGSPATFLGQTGIDSTTVLVRYTLLGDSDLSGTVTSTDFTRLVSNFGKVNQGWFQSDFNYDNKVDTVDFNLLLASFGSVLPAELPGTIPSSAPGAVVPEPIGLSTLLGAMAVMGTSRRRRN